MVLHSTAEMSAALRLLCAAERRATLRAASILTIIRPINVNAKLHNTVFLQLNLEIAHESEE